MDSIDKLAALFSEFPGIGTRQSRRFVYFLLKRNRAYVSELVRQINALRDAVLECQDCHRFFLKRGHEGETLCGICADPLRDNSIIMVVEKDADLDAIESSKTYRGKYFVLGGTLPLVEKDAAAKIRVNELASLIERRARDLREIILACALTPESEHTADYVKSAIAGDAAETNIKITTLGRGLSTGTELEYSDADTLRYALEGRK